MVGNLLGPQTDWCIEKVVVCVYVGLTNRGGDQITWPKGQLSIIDSQLFLSEF
jgi:hypothetical protein